MVKSLSSWHITLEGQAPKTQIDFVLNDQGKASKDASQKVLTPFDGLGATRKEDTTLKQQEQVLS